jgi:uncharacterized peroxidase-related enzyme
MPHVSPLADAKVPDASKSLFQQIQSQFGMVPNIFRTMGHAPEVLRGTLALEQAITRDLAPNLRELAYLKTSEFNGCHYCLHYHKAIGQQAGLSSQQIQDLEQYEQSTAYGDLEKAVLRFAEQWTRQGRVAGDVLEQLKRSLSPAQLVTLAATVGLASWTNRFNETFGVQLP